MAELDKKMQDIIDDLNKKISDLSKTGKGADVETQNKINNIKKKVITVLTQASNKIIETARDFADEEEIEKGIEIVKVKSKELYDNALFKIDELMASNKAKELNEEADELVEGVKNNVEELINKEEVNNIVDDAKRISNDMAEKAKETLKGWLKPEDK